MRGEEGGTEGWGRLVSGGAGERGAGEQRRQVGPGAQGERATRGVTRAVPVARTAPAAAQTDLKVDAALGMGTGAP